MSRIEYYKRVVGDLKDKLELAQERFPPDSFEVKVARKTLDKYILKMIESSIFRKIETNSLYEKIETKIDIHTIRSKRYTLIKRLEKHNK